MSTLPQSSTQSEIEQVKQKYAKLDPWSCTLYRFGGDNPKGISTLSDAKRTTTLSNEGKVQTEEISYLKGEIVHVKDDNQLIEIEKSSLMVETDREYLSLCPLPSHKDCLHVKKSSVPICSTQLQPMDCCDYNHTQVFDNRRSISNSTQSSLGNYQDAKVTSISYSCSYDRVRNNTIDSEEYFNMASVHVAANQSNFLQGACKSMATLPLKNNNKSTMTDIIQTTVGANIEHFENDSVSYHNPHETKTFVNHSQCCVDDRCSILDYNNFSEKKTCSEQSCCSSCCSCEIIQMNILPYDKRKLLTEREKQTDKLTPRQRGVFAEGGKCTTCTKNNVVKKRKRIIFSPNLLNSFGNKSLRTKNDKVRGPCCQLYDYKQKGSENEVYSTQTSETSMHTPLPHPYHPNYVNSKKRVETPHKNLSTGSISSISTIGSNMSIENYFTDITSPQTRTIKSCQQHGVGMPPFDIDSKVSSCSNIKSSQTGDCLKDKYSAFTIDKSIQLNETVRNNKLDKDYQHSEQRLFLNNQRTINHSSSSKSSRQISIEETYSNDSRVNSIFFKQKERKEAWNYNGSLIQTKRHLTSNPVRIQKCKEHFGHDENQSICSSSIFRPKSYHKEWDDSSRKSPDRLVLAAKKGGKHRMSLDRRKKGANFDSSFDESFSDNETHRQRNENPQNMRKHGTTLLNHTSQSTLNKIERIYGDISSQPLIGIPVNKYGTEENTHIICIKRDRLNDSSETVGKYCPISSDYVDPTIELRSHVEESPLLLKTYKKHTMKKVVSSLPLGIKSNGIYDPDRIQDSVRTKSTNMYLRQGYYEMDSVDNMSSSNGQISQKCFQYNDGLNFSNEFNHISDYHVVPQINSRFWVEKWKAEAKILRLKIIKKFWCDQFVQSSILKWNEVEFFVSNLPLTLGAIALAIVTLGVVWFKFAEESLNSCQPVHFHSSQCTFPEFPGCFLCDTDNCIYKLALMFHLACSTIAGTLVVLFFAKVFFAWRVVIDEMCSPTTSSPAGLICMTMVCVFAGHGLMGQVMVTIAGFLHLCLALWFIYMTLAYNILPDPSWYPNTVGIGLSAVKLWIYYPAPGQFLMTLSLLLNLIFFPISVVRVFLNQKISASVSWIQMSAPAVSLYALTIMAQPPFSEEQPDMTQFEKYHRIFYLPCMHCLFVISVIGLVASLQALWTRWDTFNKKEFSPAHAAFCFPLLAHANSIQAYRAAIDTFSKVSLRPSLKMCLDSYWIIILISSTGVTLVITAKFFYKLPGWTKINTLDEIQPIKNDLMIGKVTTFGETFQQKYVSPAVIIANDIGVLVRFPNQNTGCEEYVRTRRVTALGFEPIMNLNELNGEKDILLDLVARNPPRTRNRTLSVSNILYSINSSEMTDFGIYDSLLEREVTRNRTWTQTNDENAL